MDRSRLLRGPNLDVPQVGTPHPRALFFPPYRAAAQVATLVIGVSLWVVGARGAPPLGWPTKIAWVPFVVTIFVNNRWHRQAEQDATRGTR